MRVLLTLVLALLAGEAAHAQLIPNVLRLDLSGSGNAVPVLYREKHPGFYINHSRAEDDHVDMVGYCELTGVTGAVYNMWWRDSAPTRTDTGNRETGVQYDFTTTLQALFEEVEDSDNPDCNIYLFLRNKSFDSRHPAPLWLTTNGIPEASPGGGVPYWAPNVQGGETIFTWCGDSDDNGSCEDNYVLTMWNQWVAAMLAWTYDRDGSPWDGMTLEEIPGFEGFIFQETAHSLNNAFAQNASNPSACYSTTYPNCQYAPDRFRDFLIAQNNYCGSASEHAMCVQFINFINGGASNIRTVANALALLPNGRGVFAGPDILAGNTSLFGNQNRVYDVLVDYPGRRGNSFQNQSHSPPGGDNELNQGANCTPQNVGASIRCWTMQDQFFFAVGGQLNDFAVTSGGRDCRLNPDYIGSASEYPLSTLVPRCGLNVNWVLFYNPNQTGQKYKFQKPFDNAALNVNPSSSEVIADPANAWPWDTYCSTPPCPAAPTTLIPIN
jgi:hypothetical protein